MQQNFTSGSVSIAFCTLLEDYKEEKKILIAIFKERQDQNSHYTMMQIYNTIENFVNQQLGVIYQNHNQGN